MPNGGSVNQIESSDLTTTSLGELSGLPSNLSMTTVMLPSYSVRVTRRVSCSQVTRRPRRPPRLHVVSGPWGSSIGFVGNRQQARVLPRFAVRPFDALSWMHAREITMRPTPWGMPAMPTPLPEYEVFAVRYATREAQR